MADDFAKAEANLAARCLMAKKARMTDETKGHLRMIAICTGYSESVILDAADAFCKLLRQFAEPPTQDANEREK